MSLAELTPAQITEKVVLSIIQQAERRHKIVWTPSRVLMEDGSFSQIGQLTPPERRFYFDRLKKILRTFADEGILERRETPQSIGNDNEIGYDYIA